MMDTIKKENPWDIKSIYEFQYFNCPSCVYKHNSKQEFICHAYEFHPEAIDYLNNIQDDSMNDIEYPWNINMKLNIGIKEEPICDLYIPDSPENSDIKNEELIGHTQECFKVLDINMVSL